MSAVFADTAFYVAAISPRDALHRAAMDFADAYTGHIITTEYVLMEVANFFNQVGRRAAFADLVSDLRAASETEIVASSSNLFERGLTLFLSRSDKEWSLTDCTSFVVMRDLQIYDALAADRHFGQAGFRPILSP